MRKHKTPEGYAAPLRSRKAIREWLEHRSPADRRFYDYGHREGSLFCFNVKVGSVDFSFDHLLETFRDSGEMPEADPIWIEGCRERFAETEESTLWECALEDCQWGVLECDTFRHLWNDDSGSGAEWQFCGRSSGWLALRAFDGVDLTDDWNILDDIDFRTLRKLYRFVVQCGRDFRTDVITNEMEWKAAFTFFVNICADVETHADRVEQWERDQSGEHDFSPDLNQHAAL